MADRTSPPSRQFDPPPDATSEGERVVTDPQPEPVPDLDLSPDPNCGDRDCGGLADTDGTSWWCDTCGATWDLNGQRGQRGERPAAVCSADGVSPPCPDEELTG